MPLDISRRVLAIAISKFSRSPHILVPSLIPIKLLLLLLWPSVNAMRYTHQLEHFSPPTSVELTNLAEQFRFLCMTSCGPRHYVTTDGVCRRCHADCAEACMGPGVADCVQDGMPAALG